MTEASVLEGQIKELRQQTETEVYGEINAVRSAIYELHRGAELAHLNVEWVARYMSDPATLDSLGGRFLDDAISTTGRALEKLHEAKAAQARMVGHASKLKHLQSVLSGGAPS